MIQSVLEIDQIIECIWRTISTIDLVHAIIFIQDLVETRLCYKDVFVCDLIEDQLEICAYPSRLDLYTWWASILM